MRIPYPLPFEVPTCDAHRLCRPLKVVDGDYFTCAEEKALESSDGLIHRYGQVPTIEDIDDYLTYEHSAYFGYLCERNREQPIFLSNRYAHTQKCRRNEERTVGGLIAIKLTLPEILDDACGGTYVPYAKSYITHTAILNGLRYFPQAIRDVQSRDYFDKKSIVSKDAKRKRVHLFFTPRELQVIDRWGLRGYSPCRPTTLRTLLLLGLGGKHSLCAVYGLKKVDASQIGLINTERLYNQCVNAMAMEPYYTDNSFVTRFFNNNDREFQIGYDKPNVRELCGSELGDLITRKVS